MKNIGFIGLTLLLVTVGAKADPRDDALSDGGVNVAVNVPAL